MLAGLTLMVAGLSAVAPVNSALARAQRNSGSPVQPPVTLSVQNQDVRDILTMFSQSRGVNIVSSGEVEGTVTLELHEVPFDRALQAVVSLAGFQLIERDDIYFVREPLDDDSAASVLRDVATYRLDYAKPGQILPAVTALLSGVGEVTAYEPLRVIIVEDLPSVLRNVATVVEALDKAPRQVLIEARILEARMAKDVRIGVDWSVLLDRGNGTAALEGFAGTAGGGSQGLFMTWENDDVTAAIEALDEVSELNTLSAPRLLAVDGTEAEIIIGGQLGFSVVTTFENTVMQSVEFLDTGAQLRITPTITGDQYVMMQIHPELSNGVIQEGLPSKTTAEVTTDVLVKDGQTLLIGGLITEREEKIRKGIPLLKSIPLLGMFFGQTVTTIEKSELIALITPRIIEPGETIDY